MSTVRNAEWGSAGVSAAIQRWPLRRVPDSERLWCDAEALESVARLPAGTPVESKLAAYRVADGSSWRRGRFKVTRPNHARLLEESGAYVLGVYNPNSEPLASAVLVLELLEADAVDELIAGRWGECSRCGHEASTVPWSAVFPAEEVEP